MAQLDAYLTENMKARHLRLLVAIDDFRSLRDVASNATITISAVSKALAEIESGLGVKLFDRTAHGFLPTAYGECVIRHARAALGNLNQAAEEMKSLLTGSTGRVQVGALPTLISSILPKALSLFQRVSPKSTVSVFEGRMSALLPELRRGELDLIVGRLPSRSEMAGLQEHALIDTPVRLVTGAHHPLASHPNPQWADLSGFPWILPPTGSLLREPIENKLAHHGLPIQSHCIETLSTHMIRAYLQVSDAIALHSIDTMYPYADVNPIHVLPLDPNLVTRPLGIIWRSDRPLAPTAAQLLHCLKRACAVPDKTDDASPGRTLV
jgi:DNA-binding transcriptional LysR family regulator